MNWEKRGKMCTDWLWSYIQNLLRRADDWVKLLKYSFAINFSLAKILKPAAHRTNYEFRIFDSNLASLINGQVHIPTRDGHIQL
jgi:hypothetical protein